MRRLIDFTEVHAAFDRHLERNIPTPIALALSGGGDSMALLHIAQAWARRNGRRLLVLTVDHGLHPDSPAWTAFAGTTAKGVGAEWRSVHWRGPKPATGLPAAARAARHGLLADAARDAGASVILFAHTADDVAESDLMRPADAPTLGHLREWSPSPAWPEGRGLFALRPLLHVGRADLRHWLQAKHLQWLDDPANTDERYARARARALLVSSNQRRSEAGTKTAARAGLRALALSTETPSDGRLLLPRAALADVDDETARRFLSIALVCASGSSSPPRGASLMRLVARLKAECALIATLAGARLTADAVSLIFTREAGELQRFGAPNLSIGLGETAVWDGRFSISAETQLIVRPLAGSAARLGKADRTRLSQLPAAIRPALPVLFNGEDVILPRPFGVGPAYAQALSGPRLAAACGVIAHERDISAFAAAQGMAQGRQSSYVEALALA